MSGGAALVPLTESVTAFASHAEWTGALAKDEPQWLALRRTMLTASDMAGVLNLDDNAPNERKTGVSIYAEKVLGAVREIVGPDDPRFWGKVLEQPILQAAAKWHGWKYREGGALLRSKRYPWLGCTLDAEIDQGLGYGWEPLEGKTSQISRNWDEEIGHLPTWIIIQAQTQLLVTGCEVLTVYALLQGCRPCKIQIAADHAFHAVIVEEGERFMELVRRQEPPEPDWRDSTKDALNRLFPGDLGTVVDLPREAYAKTVELAALKKEIERLTREHKQTRNWLRHKIGPAMYGRLEKPVNGRAFWRWAPNRAGRKALILMAKAPKSAQPYGRNGAPVENDDEILASLEASVARFEAVPVELPSAPVDNDDDDNDDAGAPILAAPSRAPVRAGVAEAAPSPAVAAEASPGPFAAEAAPLAKCEPKQDTPGVSAPARPIRIRKGKRK